MGEQRKMNKAPVHVLFVCLGNICRSPTAHGVFAHLVRQHGLQQQILIDSAGTGDWHIGRAPDPRTCTAASQRGYDLSALRARQVCAEDFYRFDYILAMDTQNLRDLQQLQRLQPPHSRGELALFLSYGAAGKHGSSHEVPDPYHGEEDSFEHVLDLVENASQHFLQMLIERHGLIRSAE